MPRVEELGHGLWSLPVPIPDNPLGSTYVYLVSGDDGAVLVDTGWDHDESWEALTRAVEQTGHGIEDIRGAVLTHFHPDHAGLAGRLRAASGAWIAMHPADIAVTERLATSPAAERLAAMTDQLRRAGFPEEDLIVFAERTELSRPATVPDRPLEDGDTVDLPGRRLRAMWTPGHSPGHLCLHLDDADVLFTGDHVLPRITPHVGQFPLMSTEGDPLGAFLTAQADVGRLPEAERLLCLPSHEHRFTGLTDRTEAIVAHHEERLDEMTELLARGGRTTLWQVTSGLTWRRPWADMRVSARHMAAAETVAHLRLLEERGRASRTGTADLPLWAATVAGAPA